MNMRLLGRVTTPVKLWIYSHECGHQFRGPDEETADCFAVQRGRRQGWLSPGGVEEICQFIAPAKGDAMHFSGSHRCEYMRQCFTEYGIRYRELCQSPASSIRIDFALIGVPIMFPSGRWACEAIAARMFPIGNIGHLEL